VLIHSLIGVVRALFDPFPRQAQESGLPTLVGATNKHARDVYAHFGFKVVEEIVIGEGSVDKAGILCLEGRESSYTGMLAALRH
jgi:hypothetical protein